METMSITLERGETPILVSVTTHHDQHTLFAHTRDPGPNLLGSEGRVPFRERPCPPVCTRYHLLGSAKRVHDHGTTSTLFGTKVRARAHTVLCPPSCLVPTDVLHA